MIGIPTLEQTRTWCGVSVTAVSDEDLLEILDGELDIQARTLRIPDDSDTAEYPKALRRSLLRRCQRQLVAKGLPLGMIGDTGGEFGTAYLRSWDPEIRRLEDPYRKVVIA